jgi:hypothetical protein
MFAAHGSPEKQGAGRDDPAAVQHPLQAIIRRPGFKKQLLVRPSFAAVQNEKTSYIKVARRLRFKRGMVVVMDQGYIDYHWFVQLTHQGGYFVMRRKDNASFEVVETRPVLP